MSLTPKIGTQAATSRQAGFSLLELLVALTVLLAVTAIVMSGLVQTSFTEATIANRTNMHSSVRSATELLQQEIGQAGKISLPTNNVTLTGDVVGGGAPQTVSVSSTDGMFTGEKLIIDTGAAEETVTVTALTTYAPYQISAVFYQPHTNGAPVRVSGAFASGIVPHSMAHGSTDTELKLYGDINDDGNMVYIIYNCNPSNSGGTLTRSVTSNMLTATSLGPAQVLLSNVIPNPSSTPCFTYQTQTQGADTYVTNVAITLTTQTQQKDLETNRYQKETKALLNVSPRNVFEGWQLAEAGVSNRIQPIPDNVKLNLLLLQ